MWRKTRKYIVLLFLLFGIGQGFACGDCWFSKLEAILETSGNSTFKNFIRNDADGFAKFENLYKTVGLSRIDDLLDPDVLRLFDRLDENLKNNLSRQLNNTELLRFSNDFAKASSNTINAFKTNSGLIDSWKTLYNVGHDSRLNITLLYKISRLNPELRKSVGDLYRYLKAPKGYTKRIDYSVSKTINGKTITVKYDNDGFPDFTPFIPREDFLFRSNTLKGNGTDMTAANRWIRNNVGDVNNIEPLPNGTIRINGVVHTWHHHQDGRSIFPIPSSIHNVGGEFNGFAHSGGAAIIKRGLQDLFDSPAFK
ncbi:HNH endonuclease [Aquimarina algiphila]|uniref:HNH endonuclease n=1 Tax=Aquimarina algiphila TaxID=2047982 RepID=UPI00249217A8|nr:HNH endonuclease [Aquimarina algiphila]